MTGPSRRGFLKGLLAAVSVASFPPLSPDPNPED